MQRLCVIGLSLLLADLLQAQGGAAESYTDLLHGVRWPASQWNYTVRRGYFYFRPPGTHTYLVIKSVSGDLAAAMAAWKAQATKFYGSSPSYASTQKPEGPVLSASNLPFPHGLDGYAAINAGLGLVDYPRVYRETTHFFAKPGGGYRIVALIEPQQASSQLNEALAFYKSLSWLPASQLVAWEEKPLIDFETGQPVGYFHVPKDFEGMGGIAKIGTTRMPVYQVQKGDYFVRVDHITIQSQSLQTGFGGNAATFISVNGRAFQFPTPLFVQNEQEAVQVVLHLWEAETGQRWQLESLKRLPLSPELQKLRQRQSQLPFPSGVQGHTDIIPIEFSARSGSLVREAKATLYFYTSMQTSWASGSAMSDVRLSPILTIQAPENSKNWMEGVATGINASVHISSQATLTALQRFSDENKQLNRQVLELNRRQPSYSGGGSGSGQDDYNTWMSRSWTNALSDQTYLKDPQTGEVEKAYKPSWETGLFYRDPYSGYTVGGVEEGSRLQEELQQNGWYQLQESLSGQFGDND